MRVPTGRFERRTARAEVVELLQLGESKVEAITENVSARGVRLITNLNFAPGGLVRLDAPEERLKLTARVVYCQRLDEGKFAVGLQLEVCVEEWRKPPQQDSATSVRGGMARRRGLN